MHKDQKTASIHAAAPAAAPRAPRALLRASWLPVTFWVLAVLMLTAACSELAPSDAEGGGAAFGSSALEDATPESPLTLSPMDQPEVRDTGWVEIGQGVMGRRLIIEQAGDMAAVHLLRLEPSLVSFDVAYQPDAPRFLSAWCGDEGVLAAINGGFFDAQYHSTALVIHDGIASGTTYEGQGGMFAVDQWGNISLRYLSEQPYNPHEPLVEAFQSWPMLIKPGGEQVYFSLDDSERARRSVIAFDRSGRVLLLAFPGNDFTLHELANWLAASDLAIDSALNLDGGSSTGLCVNTDMYQARLDAFSPLPLVLQVRAR